MESHSHTKREGVNRLEKKHVITISRKYGSGGRKIARKLAEYLGVAYYDKYTLDALIGEYPEEVEKLDKRNKGDFMYNLSASLGFATGTGKQKFEEQAKVIEELYEHESCIIVGRGADYILRDKKDVTNVFLFADEEYRVKKAVEDYGIKEKDVAGWISVSDRTRENFYRVYTGRKWGTADNYDISIDTGHVDDDLVVEIIADYVIKRSKYE